TTKAAVAAITTGGTPIIDDPDHIEGGAAIVTVTDPVTPPGDGPRHAKPKPAATGPLRILKRRGDEES
ncbi:MAG TPA: hypothetical protein VF158_02210, partial [Longimicrobiales bacterium]